MYLKFMFLWWRDGNNFIFFKCKRTDIYKEDEPSPWQQHSTHEWIHPSVPALPTWKPRPHQSLLGRFAGGSLGGSHICTVPHSWERRWHHCQYCHSSGLWRHVSQMLDLKWATFSCQIPQEENFSFGGRVSRGWRDRRGEASLTALLCSDVWSRHVGDNWISAQELLVSTKATASTSDLNSTISLNLPVSLQLYSV